MKIFKREKYLNIIKKQLDNKDTILFLVGARQVGKTTILQSLVYFDIIPQEKTLFVNWEEILSLGIKSYSEFVEYLFSLKKSSAIKFLIIDEVQQVENIWLILKILIDKVRIWEFDFKIIVSWSWSLQVFRWMTDSLVWRKYILKVYPFSWEEFLQYKGEKDIFWISKRRYNKYKWYLLEYLRFWWYPKVVTSLSMEEKMSVLRQIYNDYLLKDIVYFLRQWEILKFKEFLKYFAVKLGSLVNISNIQQDLKLKRKEVEKFLFLVENTFLIWKLNGFVWWRASREIKKFFKVYFNDVWIINCILDFPDIDVVKWKLVENFVFNQLRVLLNSDIFSLYFYRTWWGTEVDFIIKDHLNGLLYPVEVKTGNKDNFWKGFLSFFRNYFDMIKSWYITTESVIKERQIDGKKVVFLPYALVHNISV